MMPDTKLSDEDFERYLKIRRLVDVHYDLQDVRIRTEARLRQMPKESELYGGTVRKLESSLKGKVQNSLNGIPIYEKFFSRVYGVGPLISGWIIGKTMIKFEWISKKDFKTATEYLDAPDEVRADMESKEFLRLSSDQVRLAQKTKDGNYRYPTIRGIGAFDTVSKYHAWWGLHVTEGGRRPRRKRGEAIDYDSSLRMFSHRIGASFKRLGKIRKDTAYRKKGEQSFFNKFYTKYKKRLFENPRYVKVNGKRVLSPAFKDIIENPEICPYYTEQYCSKGPCKGHLDRMAISYAVKKFLTYVWEQWRILEGLPVRPSYAFEKLGHTTYIDWEPDRE